MPVLGLIRRLGDRDAELGVVLVGVGLALAGRGLGQSVAPESAQVYGGARERPAMR